MGDCVWVCGRKGKREVGCDCVRYGRKGKGEVGCDCVRCGRKGKGEVGM